MIFESGTFWDNLGHFLEPTRGFAGLEGFFGGLLRREVFEAAEDFEGDRAGVAGFVEGLLEGVLVDGAFAGEEADVVFDFVGGNFGGVVDVGEDDFVFGEGGDETCGNAGAVEMEAVDQEADIGADIVGEFEHEGGGEDEFVFVGDAEVVRGDELEAEAEVVGGEDFGGFLEAGLVEAPGFEEGGVGRRHDPGGAGVGVELSGDFGAGVEFGEVGFPLGFVLAPFGGAPPARRDVVFCVEVLEGGEAVVDAELRVEVGGLEARGGGEGDKLGERKRAAGGASVEGDTHGSEITAV